MKVQKGLQELGPKGFFPIKVAFGSRTFPKCFTLGHKKMASNGRGNVEDKPTEGATHVTGNKGESHHFRDEHPPSDHSRDDLVEYLGTIRKELKRILSHLPDLTLVRLLEGKVQDLILGLGPYSLSSILSSKLEARSDPGLSPKLRLDATTLFFFQLLNLIH